MDSDHFSPYRTDGKLYGFVCVVTGATLPVGWAIARELAAHGAACIYACDDPADGTRKLADEIAEEYPNTKVVGYPLKPEVEGETLQLIDDVLNSWGRLDIWVACARSLGPSSIEATTPLDLQTCFETNSMAPFWALKYCPPAMAKTTPKGNYPNSAPKDQKYGSIVVISSVASTHGGCWGPAFTMSSHAALGVVRSGVAFLKGTGVRINCISPGQAEAGSSVASQPPPAVLATEEHHGGNLPEQVARVVGFLASGFSSYITGANLVVDGGASTVYPHAIPA